MCANLHAILMSNQVLNFMSILIFSWVTLVATSSSESRHLIVPTLRDHRMLTYFMESLLATMILSVFPMFWVGITIPVLMVVCYLAHRYQVTIRSVVEQALSQGLDLGRDTNPHFRIHKKDRSLIQLRRHYTAVTATNNVLLTVFGLMGLITVFSVFVKYG